VPFLSRETTFRPLELGEEAVFDLQALAEARAALTTDAAAVEARRPVVEGEVAEE
jgi:hypothetical protein